MQIISKPSTHFDERKSEIDMIVLHATATKTLADTFFYLIEKEEQPRVSAHYVIDRDGTIYQLVDDSKRAWHAGIARWDDITQDLNSHSIGIEFQCAPLSDKMLDFFTKEQIASGLELCHHLQEKYHIKAHNIVAHSDIAPERKIDPGMTFPWEIFYQQGLSDNPVRRPLIYK